MTLRPGRIETASAPEGGVTVRFALNGSEYVVPLATIVSAVIGVAMASADRRHAVNVLDAAERLVAAHPEFELLSVRRDLRRSDD